VAYSKRSSNFKRPPQFSRSYNVLKVDDPLNEVADACVCVFVCPAGAATMKWRMCIRTPVSVLDVFVWLNTRSLYKAVARSSGGAMCIKAFRTHAQFHTCTGTFILHIINVVTPRGKTERDRYVINFFYPKRRK